MDQDNGEGTMLVSARDGGNTERGMEDKVRGGSEEDASRAGGERSGAEAGGWGRHSEDYLSR